MLSQKDRDFQAHIVNLEKLVPRNNFYRRLETKLDLSFIRDLVRQHYSSHMGRPSIDPVVFFKLQLIMFFEGIRSERQLMETVNMRLDHRWYIGYDLNEKVPDHSSLSKIRDRYGLEVFQGFFERIIELCIEAGLVWGKELYFDGTKVRANASVDRMEMRWIWEARQHLKGLFPKGTWFHKVNETNDEQAMPRVDTILTKFVNKYDGTRLTRRPTLSYTRSTDRRVSPSDPDASPMRNFPRDKTKLGYHMQYVVDGGKARIILAALVTPASIMDQTPMLDLARWLRFRWQIQPEIAVGDSKFGTISNILGLENDGIRAFFPIPSLSRSKTLYPLDLFRYDADRNIYLCPERQELRLVSRVNSQELFRYQADPSICNACSVKSKCTKAKSGRSISRSFHQDYLDKVKAYADTEAYQKAFRKRRVWVEPMFAEAKQWHNMRQFRLRGLIKVNIQALLTAAGQNIKRLLKPKVRKYTPDPASAMALRLSPCLTKI